MRRIVVSCRLPEDVGSRGDANRFPTRARRFLASAEALGAIVVAWGANSLAFAWDDEMLEEAIGLAQRAREKGMPADEAWALGMAEGELEPIASKGRGAELLWGPALVTSLALATAARPGELLVDASVGAVCRGQLATLGEGVMLKAGGPVVGLRVNLADPWARPSFAPPPSEVAPPSSVPRHDSWGYSVLARRVRLLGKDAREDMLTALRRARAAAEGGAASVRCQASLALGVALAVAGRLDEALLEGLDALARAREGGDPRAIDACLAFFAKLYAAAGRAELGAKLGALARASTF